MATIPGKGVWRALGGMPAGEMGFPAEAAQPAPSVRHRPTAACALLLPARISLRTAVTQRSCKGHGSRESTTG